MTIFYADDDAEDCDLFTEALQQIDADIKCIVAKDGREALAYLQHTRDLPDYIFLDINMPFIDGWMFLDDYEHIKSKLAKPISIYMVSSSIDPRDMSRARNNGNVKDYVVKPVTREKFIELLKHAA